MNNEPRRPETPVVTVEDTCGGCGRQFRFATVAHIVDGDALCDPCYINAVPAIRAEHSVSVGTRHRRGAQ